MTIRRIGMIALNKPLNNINHLRDVFCCARLDVWGAHPKGGHILIINPLIFLGYDADGFAGFLGGGHDFIVYIRDIGDISHLRILAAQDIGQNVKNHGHPRISDMGVAVNCGPAGVKPHVGRVERREILFPAGEGIIEFQGDHGSKNPYVVSFFTGKYGKEAVRPSGNFTGLTR